ncbi:coiled-coil domain-containing protein 112-like [Liolophura sinensis]|uniref:coiled-coil domain-containing protein 112-like n=1 Tax=Liolophura sinensis TaxID=3198878 RepID=UPI003157F365
MAAKHKQSMDEDQRDQAVLAWRNKTEQTKKTDTVKEIHKLSLQIQALEREKGTHIYSKRNDFRKEFSQLEDMEAKMLTERKSENSSTRQQLQKISNAVRKFRRELKDVRPTPEFLEKLKMIMEDIEGTINSFKEQQRQRYEELLREERTTMQEVQTLDKKFEAWAHGSDNGLWAPKSARSKPLTSARDVTKDLPPEVAAFEKFLQQTGGMKGGWDEYDHNTFLKFKHRHKGKKAFLEHVIPALPTRTEEEICEHDSWYSEYLRLNDAKKEAIQRWRVKKEEEKEELMTKVEDAELCLSDEEDKTRAEKAKLQILQEKQERFSKLNAWKVQKELERAQEEERRLREQVSMEKKKEEEKKKKLELKAKVEEYKKQREEEEAFFKEQEELREQEETDRKRQLSAREISRFRQRDKERLEEKLRKEKLEEEKEKERQRKLERSKENIEVARDPSRLYKPTAGWRERMKDMGPSGNGPAINMPHRAIPSWRQGVN